jgi:hypothetical protein
VATVKTYGAGYRPQNADLTIPALEARLKEITEAHKDVTATYSVLRQAQLERVRLYALLRTRVKCLKQQVISDFTRKSVEFKMIKGIKV